MQHPRKSSLGIATLPARLRDTTLGDVLGNLHRSGASGLLEIQAIDGSSARILVLNGSPVMVLGEDEERLGGLLGSARIEEAAQLQSEGDPRLFGEILEDLGADKQAVEAALRQQTKVRLEALFALRDGTIRFRTAILESEKLRRWFRAGPRGTRMTPREFLEGRPRARVRATEEGSAPNSGEIEHERRRALSSLGLTSDADLLAIKTAFRKAVAALHPDHASSDAERAQRTERVARLSAAYHKLTQ